MCKHTGGLQLHPVTTFPLRRRQRRLPSSEEIRGRRGASGDTERDEEKKNSKHPPAAQPHPALCIIQPGITLNTCIPYGLVSLKSCCMLGL